MNPRVSVVIVNWNVRELLRACLQSLRDAAGLPAEQMQVIVVDNASADHSAEMVRESFPEVALIANTDNVGFGRANNQALPLCTAPYVLLLNPDTVVLDGAIARMVDLMEQRPDAAVAGSRLLNADGSLQRWTGGAFPRLGNLVTHYFFLDRLLPKSWRPVSFVLEKDVADVIDVDWICGASMILRVSILEGKLFNPDYFMYGEDMELCYRLKCSGGRVLYTPHAAIIHYQGESMKQQQGDVLLSSLKGPRRFFKQMNGSRWLWLYDAITVGGFGLRWLLSLLSFWLTRRQKDAARAASSLALAKRAARVAYSSNN